MRVAIYARVSTDRQGREQTIESQLTLLQQGVQEQQHLLNPEHIFIDEGYSGARLDRPGLDALRDAAAARAFDLIAILCPDRLARKYAYQVILLEELRRAGCQTVFLQRPIFDDPNDPLLLQIQGAIAEYERALLSERFRRGKLQKARAGHWVGGKAPYGYRYVPKQEGVPGHLVVDETEAEFVRLLYRWLIEAQMTIRQILKRLNEGPWTPRSGSKAWSPSTVHHILSDPVYTGTAYANRYRFVPPKKPRKPARPGASENTGRQLRPQDEWISIPVPAIIDQNIYELAQAQLSRNAALSFRNNPKYNYLLRCLLTCDTCGLALFGTTDRRPVTILNGVTTSATARTRSWPLVKSVAPNRLRGPRNWKQPFGTMLLLSCGTLTTCWPNSSSLHMKPSPGMTENGKRSSETKRILSACSARSNA